MDQDDPANWSIDRVVQELCQSQRPAWLIDADLKPILNPEAVSQAFRDNDIDGDNLLALEDADIRSDLAITSFGQRRALKNIIEHLRGLSPKYRVQLSRISRPSIATPQLSHASLKSYGFSPGYTESIIKTSIENSNVEGSTADHNPGISSRQSSAVSLHKRKHQDIGSPERRFASEVATEPHHRGEETVHVTSGPVEAPQHPVHDLHTSDTGQALFQGLTKPASLRSDVSHKPGSNDPDSAIDQTSRTVETLVNQQSAAHTGISDALSSPAQRKKLPKRGILQPVTNLIAPVSPFTSTISTSNGVEVSDIAYQQPSTEVKESGTGFPPTKRVRLANMSTSNQQHTLYKNFNNPPSAVFRPRKLRPDQIATNKVKTIQRGSSEENLNTEFCSVNLAQSIGRMHRGIFHDKNDSSALPKISKALGEATQTATSGKVHEGVSAEFSPDLLLLLQKYPVSEEDAILPLYGDSDEEDRMWTPEGDTPPPEDQCMKDSMTEDEIDVVIDACLARFRLDWQTRNLIKAQAKAHRKWMIVAKNPSLHTSMLKECRKWQTRTENRIQQLRNGIHLSDWRKADDVSQQCLALETSIHQFQEFSLYVDVLQCEKEPPRPSRVALEKSHSHRSRTIMANGDEELHSDSEDSFIVADEHARSGFPSALLASIDQENQLWNPQFTARNDSTPERREREQLVQNLSQDTAIDSIEDADQIFTPNLSGEQHNEVVDQPSNHDTNILPETPMSKKQQKLISRQKAQESATRNPMSLPDLTDSDEDNSDLDKDSQLPATKHRKQGRTRDTAIDLTLHSSPSRSERTNSIGARTPNLGTDNDIASQDQKHQFAYPRSLSHDKRSVPRSSTQSTRSPPTIYDVQRVLDMQWDDIEPVDGDHPIDVRLALAKSVYDLKPLHVPSLLDYIKSFRKGFEMKEVIQNGLSAVIEEEEQIDDVEQRNQRNAWALTNLFISYATGYRSDADEGWSEDQANDAHGLLEDGFSDFEQVLRRLLQKYAEYNHTVSISDQRSIDDSSADADTESDDTPMTMNTTSPFKKRKRKIVQSKEVLDQQRRDLQTANDQEKRRAEILEQKAKRGIDQGKLSVSINIEEPLVYLDPRIAIDIKLHQVEGIRFMWREIVENPRAQGCLLAHTMGLGKTMQVVALLALIAQCNASNDQAIKNHIPQHLQRLKILIMCPWALIQNWYEELMKWLPDPGMLGVIIKLDKDIKQPEVTLAGWSQRGGVLIIGYEKFRHLVNIPKKSSKDEEDFSERRRILLEEPVIVIADEAHKLKNATSGLNQAARQIVTKSRIALTGSPLNNHLEEYHTMIDWISPRYLGNMVQFRSKYVEPISRGLYSESTSWERKTSLKKLHVLKKIIAPKINRADITAISKDLPPKTEFFLTITLTKEQEAAYRIYVDHMRASSKQEGKLGNTMVWSWLAVLSLLLNHPSCFVRKLKQREQSEAKDLSRDSRTGSDDYSLDSDAAATPAEEAIADKSFLSLHTLNKVLHVYAEARALLRMNDPSLSNKSFLIKLILEEAVKLNEKTLIFSKSIPTLNYYEAMIKDMNLGYKRIDGSTTAAAGSRQRDVAEFNESSSLQVFLISTRAGGLGLNIQSATRVIINDFDFNPTWEEQAVGRAYRIGQTRPVFVYRFLVGGTFEELIHNKAVFKTQLFTRVVDEKNVISQAAKSPGDFLFDPKDVPQKDFSDCLGKDPHVLDRILSEVDFVRNIFLTETFFQDDDEELNEQELKEADEELELDRLERENPDEYHRRIRRMQQGQRVPYMLTNGSMPPPQMAPIGNPSQHCSHFFVPNVWSHTGSSTEVVPGKVMRTLHSYGSRQTSAPGAYDDAFVARTNTPSVLRDDQAIPSTAPAMSLTNLRNEIVNDQRRSSPYFVPFVNGRRSDSSHSIQNPIDDSASNQPVISGHSTHQEASEISAPDTSVNGSSTATVQGHDQTQENQASEPASGCRPQ